MNWSNRERQITSSHDDDDNVVLRRASPSDIRPSARASVQLKLWICLNFEFRALNVEFRGVYSAICGQVHICEVEIANFCPRDIILPVSP